MGFGQVSLGHEPTVRDRSRCDTYRQVRSFPSSHMVPRLFLVYRLTYNGYGTLTFTWQDDDPH
jgi:hypothetical protein